MDTNSAEKKSTYNAAAQKKYNKNFKNISCKVALDKYNNIITHMNRKGFRSVNSYILSLIDEDMRK